MTNKPIYVAFANPSLEKDFETLNKGKLRKTERKKIRVIAMILIDTEALIEIFDKESEKGSYALQRLKQSKENLAITSLNLHEILFGHFKRKKTIDDILYMTMIDFTARDAHLSAKIEYDLEKNGKPNTRIDTMIAAIAINNIAKILTFNNKHFQPIKKVSFF